MMLVRVIGIQGFLEVDYSGIKSERDLKASRVTHYQLYYGSPSMQNIF